MTEAAGHFAQRLTAAWSASGSMLCLGLDPDPARLPEGVGVFEFCREIIDAAAPVVCAVKPQIAYFAAQGAERELERLTAHLRDRHPQLVVVLDAKRGDIGPTAEQYAAEAFDRYGADAVTVSPYLGEDSIVPFLRRGAAFVLCRTSNPGSGDLQALIVDDEPLYQRVARRAVEWREHGEVGLVVGATYPDELGAVRAIAPGLPLLVPGVGAQGGDVDAAARAGIDATGRGMLINSSRAILYASSAADWALAAGRAAQQTATAIDAAVRRARSGS